MNISETRQLNIRTNCPANPHTHTLTYISSHTQRHAHAYARTHTHALTTHRHASTRTITYIRGIILRNLAWRAEFIVEIPWNANLTKANESKLLCSRDFFCGFAFFVFFFLRLLPSDRFFFFFSASCCSLFRHTTHSTLSVRRLRCFTACSLLFAVC